MTLNGRSLLGGGLFVALGLGLGGRAHADTWSVSVGNTCGVTIFSQPQVFAYGETASGQLELETIWNNPSWVIQNISPGPLKGTQLACASQSNNQIVVAYKDTSNTIRSRDRLSGFQEVVVPGLGTSVGQGMFAMDVSDSGVEKTVLFAENTTNSISMSVWNDNTTPKWSNPVFLAAVPGGMSVTAEHALTGYWVSTGNSPFTATTSVFVVSDDGHLRENKGPLTASGRVWVDHGTPPGESFTSLLGFGPTAKAWYNSLSGHPGSYSESEYARRITLPSASQDGIYTRQAIDDSGNFSWVKIAGSTTNPSFGQNLVSIGVRGCTLPGEPCVAAQEVVADLLPFNGTSPTFSAYYSGNTDTFPNGPSSWTMLPPTTTAIATPALTGGGGLNRGFLFFVSSATNMGIVNLDTMAVTNIGHP